MAKSSSASSAKHVIARRYAAALIDVAQNANAIQIVEKDIISIEHTLNNHKDLRDTLNNPVVSVESQHAVLRELAVLNGYHKLTINFLGVLVENRRIGNILSIITAFKAEIEKRAGIIEAKVSTAQKLTNYQEELLMRNLSAKTGKKVRLNISIDQSLIGGLVVTVGSTRIDDSIKSKLLRLGHAMTVPDAA